MRTLDDISPLEPCPPPLALWICRESREHTLKHYMFIRHPGLSAGSFYFSPARDILWLSWDVSDPMYLAELQEDYGRSLDRFKTLVIEDDEWEDGQPDIHLPGFFSILPELETILLTANDLDDDDNLLFSFPAEEHRRRADSYREGYAKFLESGKYSTATRVLYIDRSNNSY